MSDRRTLVAKQSQDRDYVLVARCITDIIEGIIVLLHLHERCICEAHSGMAFQTDYIQAIHTTTLDFLDGASATSSPDLQIKQEDIPNDE